MSIDSRLELSRPCAARICSPFAAFLLEARLIAGGRRRQEEALQELEKRVQAWSVDTYCSNRSGKGQCTSSFQGCCAANNWSFTLKSMA